MYSSEGSGDFQKSREAPKNNLHIEWTYTFDLDNLLFIVDSGAFFSLRNIAQKSGEQWIPFIGNDCGGQRCLSIDAPPELVGRFERIREIHLGSDPIPDMQHLLPTAPISPSTWLNPSSLTPHHRRLLLAQVNSTIAEAFSLLTMIQKYEPIEADIKAFSITFLEAIVPNNQAIVVNRYSPRLAPRDKNPQSPWLWYRGCLVLLTTKLDNDERFRVYVQAVVAKAKAQNREKCTAILWSIRHVAVVEISGDTVSHSDPIPLLAAYGTDEAGFLNALHLLWHYLPYPRWRIAEGSETIPSGAGDFGKLPIEIVTKIMAFTDQLHYPKYQFLSRHFFKLWWKQLRVASYTIQPDADQVDETSRCFKASSPDQNAVVDLRLRFLWGKQSGSTIWRSDEPPRTGEPENIWWSLHCRREAEERQPDKADFSQGSTKYRLQRFCSYWAENHPPIYASILPRVGDYFASQSDVFSCEFET